jgi:hypothetical protein
MLNYFKGAVTRKYNMVKNVEELSCPVVSLYDPIRLMSFRKLAKNGQNLKLKPK